MTFLFFFEKLSRLGRIVMSIRVASRINSSSRPLNDEMKKGRNKVRVDHQAVRVKLTRRAKGGLFLDLEC